MDGEQRRFEPKEVFRECGGGARWSGVRHTAGAGGEAVQRTPFQPQG